MTAVVFRPCCAWILSRFFGYACQKSLHALWRHGNSSGITVPLSGKSMLTSRFPSQRPVKQSFGVCFVIMNTQLKKQSSYRLSGTSQDMMLLFYTACYNNSLFHWRHSLRPSSICNIVSEISNQIYPLFILLNTQPNKCYQLPMTMHKRYEIINSRRIT